jgi:hypothetical protein
MELEREELGVLVVLVQERLALVEERGEEYPGMLEHLRSLKAKLLDEARWRMGSS